MSAPGRQAEGRPEGTDPAPTGQLPTAGLARPRADARIRTGDPFITSEVLYQLSYVGNFPTWWVGTC